MIPSTILTVFLFFLVLSVKASPLPDPLPVAIPDDNDQALACQPPPDQNGNNQPQQSGGGDGDDEKPEEKERKKQQADDEERHKKDEEREQKDAEHAKADEERARKESNQKPPPPSGNNQGGGANSNASPPPSPPPKQENPPTKQENPPTKQGGGQGGGTQGGGTEQGGGNTTPNKQPPTGSKPPVAGSSPLGGKTYTGPATFYGGNLDGGNCMMQGYKLPSGVYGAAIGGSNWDNSGNCGACAQVNGPDNKKITVMFVDKCPECGDGMDLFPDAFKQLNNPSVGRFTMTWQFVTCPVDGPLKIKDKEGTNEYYVSMQVQNGKEATQSLEISSDGGKTYKPGQRQDSNYFVINGQVGSQNVDVKVTSTSGKTVVVPGVPVSGAEKEASQNYK